MTYSMMKKLILNANAKVINGTWTAEEFEAYKTTQQKKIDVFYATGRLTEEQYEELSGLWVEPNEA